MSIERQLNTFNERPYEWIFLPCLRAPAPANLGVESLQSGNLVVGYQPFTDLRVRHCDRAVWPTAFGYPKPSRH